jgi:hypothetical protein
MRRLAGIALGASIVLVGAAFSGLAVAIGWFGDDQDTRPMTPAEWDEFARNAGIREAD